MDAYDIFKKLTKGLTFKHKVLGVKNNVETAKPIKKEEVQIKKEQLPENEPDVEPHCITELSDDEPEASESGDEKPPKLEKRKRDEEADGSIQLFEGVQIGGKRKKEKKEKTEDAKKKLEIEEQNRFRNEHGINAVGRHIPPALRDFSELTSRYTVSRALVDTITQCGYEEPTPIQRQAMPCMLEDRQILACAPTGSGKTAAFLVPLLHVLGAPQGGPRALVLCPTRELAQQIYREALRLSTSSELRVSVVRNMKQSKIKEREATIRKSDIVISTPNRLCYLLNQDIVNISLDKVHWLIIDEADKLFEGSLEEQADFRQQIEQVLSASESRSRRVALFSATHTPALGKWSRHHLRGLLNITIGARNVATDLVSQELLYCGNEQGKLFAFRQLVQKGLKPPVLVFVQSKDRAAQLFKELIYDGINVDVIHADRTQQQRDSTVRSFRVGRVWVLICTELMGRGIDFRGVSLVINYDFPPSAISYIHRVGRAGRAGQKGKAITFFTQEDVVNLRSIASVIRRAGCEVPQYMLEINQNSNRRKKLTSKATKRDAISTILKANDKRKKDETKENNDVDKTRRTKSVKTGKHRKSIKEQNGEHKMKDETSIKRKIYDKTKGKNKDLGKKAKPTT